MRATYRARFGRVKLTVWPRSFPWLLEIGRRQWWLADQRWRDVTAHPPHRNGQRLALLFVLLWHHRQARAGWRKGADIYIVYRLRSYIEGVLKTLPSKAKNDIPK